MKILELEKIARELEGSEVPESRKWQTDLTDIFEDDINFLIKEKAPINIGINGFVGSSKSTLALTITNYINQLQGNEMGLKQIAPDQADFMDMVLQNDRGNETIAIDEYNALIASGYDATTFNSLYKWYSDICAQKVVNRVSCAPSTIYDENCFLKLQITGKDKETKTTQALLNWRTSTDLSTREMPLGFVEIDVSTTIDPNNEWHKEYRKLKFERMSLLLDKGIRNMRELQFAELIKAVYYELKPICANVKMTTGLIETTTSRLAREKKQFHSILTEMMLTDRMKGLLTIESERARLHKRLLKEKQAYKMGKLDADKKAIFEDNLTAYKKILNEVKKQEEELDRLERIKKEYDNIWRV